MTKRKDDPFRAWLQSRMTSGRDVAALSLRLGVSGATLYNWKAGSGVSLSVAVEVIREAAKDDVMLTTDHLLPRAK